MTSNLLAALKSNQARNNLVNISPLIEAAKNGQLHACERALDEPKIKVDQRDSDGATSLMHSASRGYLEIVKLLVERGARVCLSWTISEHFFDHETKKQKNYDSVHLRETRSMPRMIWEKLRS